MELQGTIKLIGQTKEYGSNGFQKRELVLTTEEQYPQHILIEFIKDKCAVLDKYKVEQRVRIGINIKGREWQSPQGEVKYFNSIQGWRIEALSGDETTPPPPQPPFETIPEPKDEQVDDLPFF